MTGIRVTTVALTSALSVVVLGGCRRTEMAPQPPAPAPPPPSKPVVEPPTDAAAADDAAAPGPALGAWLDATVYRFRLDAIRRCTAGAPAGGSRIGAVVRVTSNIDGLLVNARDVKLEAGGVILDSAIVTAAPPGCAPLLPAAPLRAKKTATGVVVFDVPPEFNPQHRAVKLSYQPTRWGGARKVEAVLPPGALAP